MFRVLWYFNITVVAIATAVFAVSSLFLSTSVKAAPGINEQFNFQGRLLNSAGAAVPDGFYNIQFKIYQDGTGQAAGNPGGTLMWTESWLNSSGSGVQIKNGYLSVELGSITPFANSVDWNQNTLWLSINIGNTNGSCASFPSCSPDGEMTPMKRLSSTPYALNAGMLGGKKASDFLQIAQGVQTDVSTNTPSIYINKTGTGDFVKYQQAGNDALTLTNSGDILFGANTNHNISIASVNSGDGRHLTIAAGSSATGKGGDLHLSGGDGTTKGLVNLGAASYTATVNPNCSTNCTLLQTNVDNYSTVIVNATATNIVMTLPAPTTNTIGRIIYVTAAESSQDFTLTTNTGGTGNEVSMRKNTTVTMIWNGTAWTAAGASSSTTLQAAYDNTLQSAGGAELVVSKTNSTNGLTIRDSSVNSVNGALLSVQSSSAAGLLSVNSVVAEYASNSGAEEPGNTDTSFPVNTWGSLNSAAVDRFTTVGPYIASGKGSVYVRTNTSAGSGVSNRLTAPLTDNMTYNVSFATRLESGTLTDMEVYYSANGSASSVACASNITSPSSIWKKVNCTFKTPASGITADNALMIRQASGGTSRTFYIDNLSVTLAADVNYATDGSVNDGDNFASNWLFAGLGGGSATRNTSDGEDASDSAQVTLTAGAANAGIRNKLSVNPLPDTLYRVTVYAKNSSGTFNDFKVRYSRDGSTNAGGNYTDCVDYNTRSISTTAWTRVTCYIKTDSTLATNPHVHFVGEASATRTFRVDAFTMTLTTNTAPNVQIGGGEKGGPTTLFTLDKAASAPIAINNDALLGSMYYDTTLGKLQCYEADGWGACGSSPDTIVTIAPEFTNAVLHGTGVGTMVSDICSDTLNINDGSAGQANICGPNETHNFYRWTSPQPSAQTYGIYVTYQLPASFKSFQSGSTSIKGRTDSNNASVSYQVYKNDANTGLTACGPLVNVSSGNASAWQPGAAAGTSDPSTCGFNPGNSVVFKINTTASQNANAYIGDLNFVFSNR